MAGPYQFTHVAAHQAWFAAVNSLFGGLRKFRADYSVIPWATFTDPEVARVGLNEQEACERGVAYEVTRYDLEDLDRAIADGTNQGEVKVLTVPGRDKILGVTIVAPRAGDLLAEFVLAMRHGLGLQKILSTIHIYPTMSEANKYVAGEWKKAHKPEKCWPGCSLSTPGCGVNGGLLEHTSRAARIPPFPWCSVGRANLIATVTSTVAALGTLRIRPTQVRPCLGQSQLSICEELLIYCAFSNCFVRNSPRDKPLFLFLGKGIG